MEAGGLVSRPRDTFAQLHPGKEGVVRRLSAIPWEIGTKKLVPPPIGMLADVLSRADQRAENVAE